MALSRYRDALVQRCGPERLHLPSSLLTLVSMVTCGMSRSMRCSRMDRLLPLRSLAWYGSNRAGAYIRVCQTDPKVRLRLPRDGTTEVLQNGYRLVLLPRLAFFALWDGTGDAFRVPRAKVSSNEAALPGGSYASDTAEPAGAAGNPDASPLRAQHLPSSTPDPAQGDPQSPLCSPGPTAQRHAEWRPAGVRGPHPAHGGRIRQRLKRLKGALKASELHTIKETEHELSQIGGKSSCAWHAAGRIASGSPSDGVPLRTALRSRSRYGICRRGTAGASAASSSAMVTRGA